MSLDECMKPIEVLGHKIDITLLKNPKLRRLLGTQSENGFLFHRKDHHTEHDGVVQHTDHTDRHNDHHQDHGHSEFAGNYTGKGNWSPGYDAHTDKGYSEHTEHTGR